MSTPSLGTRATPPSPNGAIGETASRPARPHHRGAILAGAAAAAVVGALILSVRLVSAPAGSVSPSPAAVSSGPDGSGSVAVTSTGWGRPPDGYIADRVGIEQRVARAGEGREPFATGVRNLLDFAAAARLKDPRPKASLNISGTGGPFVDDSAAAYGLALAYVATGDVTYAEAASRYLMAWATTNRTTRNTCTNSGDCQTSLIISRNAPGFAFAADLIAPSGVMTPTEATTFRGWLRDVILPTASERDNNWGDAGTFARMALTSYLGDAAGFDAAVVRWRESMDLVAADGHIPEEVRRASSGITYTQEALQYKVGAAVIAARRGVDLWDYEGKAGGSLQGALDYLVSFLDAPDRWPWNDHAEFPTPSPMWELVYAKWPDERYANLLRAERPFSEDGHSAIRWTTVTNGIALDDDLAQPTSVP